MERWAPRACLALLWGCTLGAAAAQGKEGECARGGRPSPPNPGGPTTGLTRLPELGAPGSAQLWKPTWRRAGRECWGRQDARAAIGTNLGSPPGAIGAAGTMGGGLGVRGLEAAEKGTQRRPRCCSPGGGFRKASWRGRGGPLENRVSRGLSARGPSPLVT